MTNSNEAKATNKLIIEKDLLGGSKAWKVSLRVDNLDYVLERFRTNKQAIEYAVNHTRGEF